MAIAIACVDTLTRSPVRGGKHVDYEMFTTKQPLDLCVVFFSVETVLEKYLVHRAEPGSCSKEGRLPPRSIAGDLLPNSGVKRPSKFVLKATGHRLTSSHMSFLTPLFSSCTALAATDTRAPRQAHDVRGVSSLSSRLRSPGSATYHSPAHYSQSSAADHSVPRDLVDRHRVHPAFFSIRVRPKQIRALARRSFLVDNSLSMRRDQIFADPSKSRKRGGRRAQR